MQNEAKFLTITQAAEFLKVSPDTLRRWEEKGIVNPQRTKGGARRYTLLDLKIAKLNKRKTKFFQIPTLLRQNYINSKRDFKIALLTSFLWIFGLLFYHFLSPTLSLPANPEKQILSDQMKEQTSLKIASETTPIKVGVVKVLMIQDTAGISDKKVPAVNPGSDLLIRRYTDTPASPAFGVASPNRGEPTLQYTDSTDQYYLLKPLPKSQIPTLIKRI